MPPTAAPYEPEARASACVFQHAHARASGAYQTARTRSRVGLIIRRAQHRGALRSRRERVHSCCPVDAPDRGALRARTASECVCISHAHAGASGAYQTARTRSRFGLVIRRAQHRGVLRSRRERVHSCCPVDAPDRGALRARTASECVCISHAHAGASGAYQTARTRSRFGLVIRRAQHRGVLRSRRERVHSCCPVDAPDRGALRARTASECVCISHAHAGASGAYQTARTRSRFGLVIRRAQHRGVLRSRRERVRACCPVDAPDRGALRARTASECVCISHAHAGASGAYQTARTRSRFGLVIRRAQHRGVLRSRRERVRACCPVDAPDRGALRARTASECVCISHAHAGASGAYQTARTRSRFGLVIRRAQHRGVLRSRRERVHSCCPVDAPDRGALRARSASECVCISHAHAGASGAYQTARTHSLARRAYNRTSPASRCLTIPPRASAFLLPSRCPRSRRLTSPKRERVRAYFACTRWRVGLVSDGTHSLARRACNQTSPASRCFTIPPRASACVFQHAHAGASGAYQTARTRSRVGLVIRRAQHRGALRSRRERVHSCCPVDAPDRGALRARSASECVCISACTHSRVGRVSDGTHSLARRAYNQTSPASRCFTIPPRASAFLLPSRCPRPRRLTSPNRERVRLYFACTRWRVGRVSDGTHSLALRACNKTSPASRCFTIPPRASACLLPSRCPRPRRLTSPNRERVRVYFACTRWRVGRVSDGTHSLALRACNQTSPASRCFTIPPRASAFLLPSRCPRPRRLTSPKRERVRVYFACTRWRVGRVSDGTHALARASG